MSGLMWGDVPGWVGSLGTIGALGFAGVQLRQIRRQSAEDRLLETRGVAVTLVPAVFPDSPAHDGSATISYRFTVHNPGRFPIEDVRLTVRFAFEVQRVHRSGRVEPPTTCLDMATPVIVGASDRQWDRRLKLGWSDMTRIAETVAEIRFDDIRGVSTTNYWPRERP